MASSDQVREFMEFLAASRIVITTRTYPFQRGWDEAIEAVQRKAQALLLGAPAPPAPVVCRHGNRLTDLDGQVIEASCGCHHADVLGEEGGNGEA